MFADNELLVLLPALRNSAYYLTRDKDEAQDLMQDAVTRALQYRRSFKDGSNLLGWVRFIMRNIFISEFRRRKKWVGAMPDIWDVPAPDDQEQAIHLRDAEAELAKMPADRRFIVLRAALGDEIQEIADHLGRPNGTVKSNMARGRQQMRSALA